MQDWSCWLCCCSRCLLCYFILKGAPAYWSAGPVGNQPDILACSFKELTAAIGMTTGHLLVVRLLPVLDPVAACCRQL